MTRQISTAGNLMWSPPEGQRRLTINLDKELHQSLKRVAVEKNTTVTKIVVSLARQHIHGINKENAKILSQIEQLKSKIVKVTS